MRWGFPAVSSPPPITLIRCREGLSATGCTTGAILHNSGDPLRQRPSPTSLSPPRRLCALRRCPRAVLPQRTSDGKVEFVKNQWVLPLDLLLVDPKDSNTSHSPPPSPKKIMLLKNGWSTSCIQSKSLLISVTKRIKQLKPRMNFKKWCRIVAR